VVIINTARGGIIDSEALLEALNNGKVAYALLDVLEHEANLDADKELILHPHVYSTPHIAFYADDSMRNMYTDCFQSIDEWMRGEKPLHEVHPITPVQK
jgi:phosphoglycerate dehydrogenase-like enzyme